MMKMERPLQPDWLKEKYKRFGRKYKENREKGISEYKAQHNLKDVYQQLLPILRDSTNKHCAFCDDKIQKGTIEHFRPKSTFPRLAYLWINLFPACNVCQEKNNDFDRNLLRPDKADYQFRRFFLYNSFTGKIIVNPKANDLEKVRAEVTIRIYKLNRQELIEARLDAFEEYENFSFDKRPFRFIFAR